MTVGCKFDFSLAQVYRGLDIGSAKVTPDEAQAVRHHLVDVAELDSEEAFSVGDFCDLAERNIKVCSWGIQLS